MEIKYPENKRQIKSCSINFEDTLKQKDVMKIDLNEIAESSENPAEFMKYTG